MNRPTTRFCANAGLAAAAVFVFAVWVWGADTVSTSLNGDPRSTLDGLVKGTAYNPFVQRALVPAATREIVGAIPPAWKDGVTGILLASPKFTKEAARLGWDTREIPEYIVSLSLALAALVAFPFVLRSLFLSLYDVDVVVANLVALGVLLGLPPFFLVGTHYIYDFPSLLFFTAGLYLLLRRKWILFYLMFILGCVNKETMVLLAAATVILNSRTMPRGKLLSHVLAQVLIFGVIKTILVLTFRNNPGGSLEFHLWGNIHNLLFPYTFETAFLLIVACVLVFSDFHSKHPALRKAALLLVPFWLLMFTFAWMTEIRDLYEIYPVYALLAAHTIAFSSMKKPYALLA